MKTKVCCSILTAGLAMATSNVASAQSSVTLYGLLDNGVQYKTNANAAGNSVVTTGTAGAAYPSRFGFRGTEDLGGGLSAVFQLENGFLINNGQLVSSDVLFNRQSWIGLSSKYGTLTFGRQYSVQYDKTVYYDPTLFNNYSIFSLNIIPPATVRANNSIKFQSQKLNGFNFEAMYGFGQQLPGSYQAGKYYGVGAEYNGGSVSASVAYEAVHGTVAGAADNSGAVDRRLSAVAKYTIGPVQLSGGFVAVRGDLHSSPDGNVYWGGVVYLPNPYWKLSAEAGRYYFNGQPGAPTVYNLAAMYSLSKRTSLYVTGGQMFNAGGSNFGIANYTTTSVAGQTQLAVAGGLIVRF
ncbi:porin [Burkholderia cepacia]|uniref:porin n=1 Tax=Burkholderia cepacia TaxID=292 RepID=UPI001F341B9F|nr:porin [Burkholderia cepacia]MCE4124377.1 porin [Burkholderia cepacia]